MITEFKVKKCKKEIWTIDAETDPFDGRTIPAPFVWGLYNGSEYHKFYDTDDAVNFLAERDCICYAHNGGKFDYHFLLHRLHPFEPLNVISGRIAKFKIGLCEFRDSYNILPFPLSAYQKDAIDYKIMHKDLRDIPKNKKEIEQYLKMDCVYLWDLIRDFINGYGLHLTIAGASVKIWEAITEEKAPKTTGDFYERMSSYYYGGRVQCFEGGEIKDKFKVIDINSAYPFAMQKDHAYGENFSVGVELPKTTAYIQRSFITLECISNGALPFRTKDGGLSFPADNVRRTFKVTGWEYLAGVDTETIKDIKIVEVVTFPQKINFTKYIRHFYSMREKTKILLKKYKENSPEWLQAKAQDTFAKLFLNSLYGKFGSCPDKYKEYTVVDDKFVDAAKVDNWDFGAKLGCWSLMQKDISEDKKRFYNVAVAASITGFVRAYLWRAIRECSGVMYCDTDSIACRDTGNLNLDPSILGEWDIEANCSYGAIAGKKLYAFYDDDKQKYKTASKGVRLEAVDIIRVAQGENVLFEPIAPSFSLKRGTKFISRNVRASVALNM